MSADSIPEEGEEALTPRNNPDLFGHEKAESVLHGAWESGHLHHAWLITGPMGIGKATLAHRFARFLLSQGAAHEAKGGGDLFAGDPDCDPGGAPVAGVLHTDPGSRIFGRVAAGGHADLLTVTRSIDPKSKKLRGEIVVDDVRGIGGFLHMTAAEGGFRVVVIDAGDEMNRNAANALLKSLEEPPANTVILLVSHTPGRLLPTIRSRCRELRLAPLGEADFAAVLTRVTALVEPGLEQPERDELFRLSGGSPGKALRLADEGGLELYHQVLELLSTLVPGQAGRRTGADSAALHALADRVAGKKGEAAYHTLVDLLGSWVSRLIRLGAGGGAVGGAGPEEAPLMRRFLAAASLDQWLEVWDNQQALFAQTDGLNLDRRQAILNAFFNLEKTVRA
ncbi:MAG: DNA polymerase III subunit delta' [Alphaproteobacteria bacterium]|nr:DNA polymerase III subunit delta' [Alphaproteobacteria bacterium]